MESWIFFCGALTGSAVMWVFWAQPARRRYNEFCGLLKGAEDNAEFWKDEWKKQNFEETTPVTRDDIK